MSAAAAAGELSRDSRGFLRSGDISITVVHGESTMFVWPNAIGYGLMVDSSLDGADRTIWEIHSTIGFSTHVAFGRLPQFAEEIVAPMLLVRGRRYFVSVYGTYPRYGIQEFEIND